MKEFYIEYRTPKSLIKGKRGSDLAKLLREIQADGCRISTADINGAVAWGATAKSGSKHYVGCVCTIRKGEAEMTEYTSF